MNVDFGTLDDTSIPWNRYQVHTILNLLLWVVILLLPLVVLYFFPVLWKKMVQWVSLTLTAVQLVALIAILPSAAWDSNTPYYVFREENKFNLSHQQNTVIFVLDTFSGTIMDSILQEYPDTVEDFSDFMWFKNYGSSTSLTFPSIPVMLTGCDWDYTAPYKDTLQKAWSSPTANTFYKRMDAAGYDCTLFSMPSTLGNFGADLLGKYDNMIEAERLVNNGALLHSMAQLSAYRYMPHAMKPTFGMGANDLARATQVDTSYKITRGNGNMVFYDQLLSTRVDSTYPRHQFILYHLEGIHRPYTMDETASLNLQATAIQQAKGCLEIVMEYLQQMKELGLYENANIIITADHGANKLEDGVAGPSPLLMIKTAGKKGTELRQTHAPVTQLDFFSNRS